MYEKRYGLTLNPFRTTASGPQVFVGPQQSKLISSLQKALSGADNVVVVSGAAGVGKTTLVTRALETNKAHHMVAWVGRMRLAADDVLTLLLAGFGLAKIPAGAVQRFSVFKQILAKRAAQNIQVVVVVEDALRLGNETLQELEAVTAAEDNGSGGANIILMGPPEIERRLNFPELARLKQRARSPRKVTELSFPEVHGYLAHALRLAGGDYNRLFEASAAAMLYRCSEGIPRVINKICDSALAAAADAGDDALSAELIRRVAADEYGLEPVLDEPAPVTAAQLASEGKNKLSSGSPRATEAKPAAKGSTPKPAASDHTPDLDLDIPAVVVDALAQEAAERPRPAAGAKSQNEKPRRLTLDDLAEGDDIPGDLLIADTGMNVAPEFEPDPELDIPASQLVRDQDRPDASPSTEADSTEDLPMLSNSMRVDIAEEVSRARQQDDGPTHASGNDGEEEPDFEAAAAEFREEEPVEELCADVESTATYKALGNDPLGALASLPRATAPAKPPAPKPVKSTAKDNEDGPIPDLDALEAAISAARRGDVLPGPVASIVLDDDRPAKAGPAIEPAVESSAARTTDTAGPAVAPGPAVKSPPRADSDSGSRKAAVPEITLDKALEDQRREGLQLDAMAAELAKAQSLEDISDKMAETLFGIEFEQIAAAALANPPAAGTLPGDDHHEPDVVAAQSEIDELADGGSANDSMNELSPLALEEDPLADLPDPEHAFDDPSAEAEADAPGKSIVMQEEPDTSPTSSNSLESIEDQFKTGMTQTLKALNVAAKGQQEADEARGLFGKLKKTFRS